MNTEIINTTAAKTNELSRIESMDAKLLHLHALEDSIKNQINEISNSRSALIGKINELPKFLSVADLDEAFQIIKALRNLKEHSNNVAVKESASVVEKSEVFEVTRQGRKLLRRTTNEVISLLKTNQYTTAQISQRTGVSASAINSIKKRSGLVKERAVAV